MWPQWRRDWCSMTILTWRVQRRLRWGRANKANKYGVSFTESGFAGRRRRSAAKFDSRTDGNVLRQRQGRHVAGQTLAARHRTGLQFVSRLLLFAEVRHWRA